MRVLVTGAGGFVGRHMAKALARRGWHVLAVVHRRRPADLEGVRGIDIVQADLGSSNPPSLYGSCRAIVHCAAALPSTVPDEAELYRRNVQGMQHLLSFAIAAGARTFLYCSSMAVFGRIEVDVVKPDTAIAKPGAYGHSKLEGERLLAAAAAAGRLHALSVRLPGVVGAGSHDNFLSDLVAAMQDGRAIVVSNPQALFNNIVHVDDLVAFFGDLLNTLDSGHRVTTIAADEPMTIQAVVEHLCAVSGRWARAIYKTGGRPFLICPEAARALGYRVPSVEDSVRRLARDCLSPARGAAQ